MLSTDAAHSLGDALGVPVGSGTGAPVELDGGLFVQQVDAQRRFERSWQEIQGYLMSVLSSAGVDPIEAEELTVLPGAEEVLALLEVRDQVRSGRWDLVIVDCAPTAETLRLLALPDALGWYMERVFPIERRVVRTLRPVLGRVAGVPMPRNRVFDAVERLHAELGEVREVLSGPDASVRLVLTPESVVVAEARRTLTSLSLFGYRVDGVVANRVFPAGGDDLAAGLGRGPGRAARGGRGVLHAAPGLSHAVPAERAGRGGCAARPGTADVRRRRPVRGGDRRGSRAGRALGGGVRAVPGAAAGAA